VATSDLDATGDGLNGVVAIRERHPVEVALASGLQLFERVDLLVVDPQLHFLAQADGKGGDRDQHLNAVAGVAVFVVQLTYPTRDCAVCR